MTYVIGDLVRIKVTWTDTDDALIDPTTIVLRVKDPMGTVTVYTYALGEVVRESLGVYHYDVATGALNGVWYYRFEAGGAAVGAEEGSFRVEASLVI
jgi:uncharacterized protein YfaS (alpha-2-macroglobulin family)